jgi:hypothetical protein
MLEINRKYTNIWIELTKICFATILEIQISGNLNLYCSGVGDFKSSRTTQQAAGF